MSTGRSQTTNHEVLGANQQFFLRIPIIFQWKEPLTEERIILVRIRKVGARGGVSGRLTDPHLMDEDTHLLRFETTLHQPTQFRSRRFSIMAVDYVHHPSIPSGLTPFVEILPDQERYDIRLPAISRSATGPSGFSMSDGFSYELLTEHPFKSYELGEPSKLVFTSDTISLKCLCIDCVNQVKKLAWSGQEVLSPRKVSGARCPAYGETNAIAKHHMHYYSSEMVLRLGYAFTSDDTVYGKKLVRLHPGDIVFMYVSDKGVRAAGMVIKEWMELNTLNP